MIGIRPAWAFLIVYLMFFTSFLQPAYAGSTNLVGYWDLNEAIGSTIKDQSGLNNHGSLSGATHELGKFNNALRFDGVDDFAVIPDSQSLRIQVFTLEAWIFMSKVPSEQSLDNDVALINKLHRAIGSCYGFRLGFEDPTTTNYGLAVSIGDGSSQRVVVKYNGTTPLTIGEWHHVAGTYDGSIARVYVDGQLLASSKPLEINLVNNNAPLTLGNELWGEDAHFSGVMDDVKVYNRALTDGEILRDYMLNPNQNWQYQKTITLNELSGKTLINYPIRLVIDTAELVNAGKMRIDGADIRFKDSDNVTSLNYWIESGMYTSSTVVWVNVPVLTAYATKRIYLQYGYSTAVSKSDGEKTFSFFDDFSGDVIDPSKYVENVLGVITYEIDDALIIKDTKERDAESWLYDGTDKGSQVELNIQIEDDYAVEWRSQLSSLTKNEMGEAGIGLVDSQDRLVVWLGHADGTDVLLQPSIYAIANDSLIGVPSDWKKSDYGNGTDNRVYMYTDINDERIFRIEKLGDHIKLFSGSDKMAEADLSRKVRGISIMVGAYGSFPFLDSVKIDDLRVRKLVNYTPTYSIGQEVKIKRPFITIDEFSVDDNRVDVGSSRRVSMRLRWDNGTLVSEGKIGVNGKIYDVDVDGIISFLDSHSEVCKVAYQITSMNCSEIQDFEQIVESPSIIWDRVKITLNIVDTHINVGSTPEITWVANYEYDGGQFMGEIDFKLEAGGSSGKAIFVVRAIKDDLYGLNSYESQPVECIRDRILIKEGGVMKPVATIGETVSVWFRAYYEYGDEEFTGDDGILYVNDEVVYWSSVDRAWRYEVKLNEVGTRDFVVTRVADDRYGLTTFVDNFGSLSVRWEKPFIETPLGIASILVILAVVAIGAVRIRASRKRM